MFLRAGLVESLGREQLTRVALTLTLARSKMRQRQSIEGVGSRTVCDGGIRWNTPN